MPVEQLLLSEIRQKRCNGFADALLRRIRVGVRRVLRCRSGHRDAFRCFGTIWLMFFEARKTWKFVTNFDHAVLVRLEEEADVAVVHHRHVFVLCCFLGRELYVSIYPSLTKSDLDVT